MTRFKDMEPVVCAVCKRQAIGIGTCGNRRKWPPAWVCADPICQAVLNKVANMPGGQLNAYESSALADAGDVAGVYLETLGKTDLGEMRPEEWLRFLKLILTTYESRMRERLTGNNS